MGNNIDTRSLGWLPDYPDIRDFTPKNEQVQSLLEKTDLFQVNAEELPASANLREWFPGVEDQGQLGSCTANAGAGIVEYFEKRAFGKHVDASRLFLYKVTRKMMNVEGDTGAFLRSTMGALVMFGVPPEEYWPYEIADYDKEPSAFCYAFAQNYQAIKYFRLDPPNASRDKLLNKIKKYLTTGIPAMFGFTVYNSISEADANAGKIPFPAPGETIAGGHAVVAVGYDDDITIKASGPEAKETKGAFLIRNSWGAEWGDNGYGWLPYEYLNQGLAEDWWALLKGEWVDTDQFKAAA